jgi:hypothetical protein
MEDISTRIDIIDILRKVCAKYNDVRSHISNSAVNALSLKSNSILHDRLFRYQSP